MARPIISTRLTKAQKAKIEADELRDMIKKEYAKCAADPEYFIRTYCLIKHPKRGIIPFDLYKFQDKTLNVIKNNSRCIILKSRQMGISTLTAGYSLWFMMFHENKIIYTVATKLKVAKNLVAKIKLMHTNLPSWLRESLTEDNVLSLRFKNGSVVTAGTAASDEGRSEAISLFIIDEAAHIKENTMKELWGAIQPTLSTGGDLIVLSTPNGVGNWFHKTYTEAIEGVNGYAPIFLHWSFHPERDQKWRDQQDRELGVRKAKQEVDGDFLSSGESVFDGELIQEYINKKTEPIEKPVLDKGVYIFKEPEANHRYLLAADVARGDSDDQSAFEILDIETLEQVAEYNGLIGTTEYANLCIKYATMYNDAILIPENTGLGWATVQAIIDRGYKNLFYTSENLKFNDPDQKRKSSKAKKTPGFSTSSVTRPLAINKLITLFEEGVLDIKSERLLNQMKVFIWNGKKAEAMSGYHDDMVMALAIGLYVRDISILKSNQNVDVTKSLIDAIGVKYEDDYYHNANRQKYVEQNIIASRGGINTKELDISWLTD